MGAKDISKTMTLKDGVSSVLGKISAGTVKYKKDLQDLKQTGNDTWTSLRTGIVTVAGVAAGFFGLGAAAEFVGRSVEGVEAMTEASTKLATIMKGTVGATNAQIESVKTYADELEKSGVVAADVTLAGSQQLATFSLQSDTIKKLMPGMNDLLAQTKGVKAAQGDAVSVGNLFGKVMDGQTGALSKLGISFTAAQEKMLKHGTEQQRAATLAEVISKNVGGVNKALAQTDAGKLAQVANAMGGIEDAVGLLYLKVKTEFAGVFLQYLPQITTWVEGAAGAVTSWAANGGIERVAAGIKSVSDIASGTYQFFRNNWTLIGPIIYGIVASFTAYKVSAMGAAFWTAVFGKEATFSSISTAFMGTAALVASGQISILAGAQRLLNAAWNANPIGVIITLLGLLVIAGIYVVKNWEQVKLAGMRTWNTVVGAAEWAVNKYFTFANFMMKIYKYAWDSIEYAGKSIWNGILTAGEAGVNGFIGLVNSMINKSLEGINSLIGKANSISKSLGLGTIANELSFEGMKKVSFGGAKANAEKPKWDSGFNVFPQVNFGGAKFSDDAIMKQVSKVQAEKDKKKGKNDDPLTKALKENTAALAKNTEETGKNTNATGKNTETLKGNKTGMDIADGLLARVERHMYGV
ncbi:hypothetical protein [Paenibacillus gansuensis]|uniref:Uncharacterized protein n=1 Tax=Paenibacillus gansuensis TaxID=306542 RepID=A0ABW5PH81_9BACL